MKNLFLLTLMFSALNSYAGLCIDLKFDTGTKLCQAEMIRFNNSIATDDYVEASYAKDSCFDDFFRRCENLKGIGNNKLCNEFAIQLEDIVCNMAVKAAHKAKGTRSEKKTLKALRACRKEFVNLCKFVVK